MISEQTREELIATGERQRADYLVEQAGYTLGLAELDGERLAFLLPDAFVADVRRLLDQLRAVGQDRTLLAAEARDARRRHLTAFAQAEVWRRTVSCRTSIARHPNSPPGQSRWGCQTGYASGHSPLRPSLNLPVGLHPMCRTSTS